jgi:hypothetical protein
MVFYKKKYRIKMVSHEKWYKKNADNIACRVTFIYRTHRLVCSFTALVALYKMVSYKNCAYKNGI